MKNQLLALSFLFAFTGFGQNENRKGYDNSAQEADEYYQKKEYKKSAEKYKEAFDYLDGKAIPYHRYNAACSYALAGDRENSFFHLFRLAEGAPKYSNYDHISTDTDLDSLHSDERWEKLLSIVKANKYELEKDYDRPLIALLDTIYREDQTYRRQIKEIEDKYGRDSEEMKAHWKLINEKDSINLITVKKILDERGWLGPNVIGPQGNSTLFLVIQHSDQETQEKYLPMMREAVKNGNAMASSLALLEDRVSLRKGEKQIYGSQIGRDPETGEYYVLPLTDPDNVDQRRKEVGLGPLQEYISIWGVTWDVETYKKQLPEIEAKQKK